MTADSRAKTFDDAIAWIGKAQQLGFYSSNVARLMRAAAQAVSSVLDESEPRDLEYLREQLHDHLYARMVNKAGTITAETAKTYISRVQRLLRDFEGWSADPRAYRPRSTRRAPTERRARSVTEPTSGGTQAALSFEEEPSKPYAEHTLPLETGRAYFRVPTRISLDEFRLIMVVLASHCPEAAKAWPVVPGAAT